MEKQSGENEVEECSDQEQIAHRKCSCGTSTFKTVKWVYVTLFSLLCNIAFIVLFVIVFRELNKLNAKCTEKTWPPSSLNAFRLHFSTVPPLKSNGPDVSLNVNRTSEKENTTVRPGEESRIVTLLNEVRITGKACKLRYFGTVVDCGVLSIIFSSRNLDLHSFSCIVFGCA